MLTDDQLHGMFLRVNRAAGTDTQFNNLKSIDQLNSDDAAITIMAKQTINGGYASPNAYFVLQTVQMATGVVPTLSQCATWINYLNTGGSQPSMSDAFVASDMFGTLYNGGVDVDPHSTITATVVQGIINAAHAGWNSDGTASQAQIDHWVGTGLPTDQVFVAFAQGDQYTALVQTHAINYFRASLWNYLDPTNHPTYPSGNIFSI